ncbi:hypothetical protein [Streptomyces sp. MMG1121]|uniref:hypothetical protein n=1 Tax=Streptomyces sp. MMG1121 TaxID=1415544 RepID=UPI0006AF5B87|nr:hypothetical protein [Streptomyces sp. MMG1121]KOV61696.1 hypothetical protein ADK64_27275 [Streptomyces sp. MMG1121]
MSSESTDAATIRQWLAEAWSRTAAAVLLGGPDLRAPLAERPVVGEIFDPAALARLRDLTTTGEFTGDICRCPGSPTVALLDTDAEFIAAGSLHGDRDMSWERARFHNNLTVADPEALYTFLNTHRSHGS